ncbi:hypothetical protein LguiA_020773 [Lonicera macranthoides]
MAELKDVHNKIYQAGYDLGLVVALVPSIRDLRHPVFIPIKWDSLVVDDGKEQGGSAAEVDNGGDVGGATTRGDVEDTGDHDLMKNLETTWLVNVFPTDDANCKPPFCTTPQLHHRFSIRPPHYAATPPLSNRAIPPEKQTRRGGHSRPKKEISKIECFNDKGGRRGSITEILGTIHLNLCKKQESPFILVRDQKSQISNKCENQLDDVKIRIFKGGAVLLKIIVARFRLIFIIIDIFVTTRKSIRVV